MAMDLVKDESIRVGVGVEHFGPPLLWSGSSLNRQATKRFEACDFRVPPFLREAKPDESQAIRWAMSHQTARFFNPRRFALRRNGNSGQRRTSKWGHLKIRGPPVVPFYPFLVGRVTSTDFRKMGTLSLASLLEDLVQMGPLTNTKGAFPSPKYEFQTDWSPTSSNFDFKARRRRKPMLLIQDCSPKTSDAFRCAMHMFLCGSNVCES